MGTTNYARSRARASAQRAIDVASRALARGSITEAMWHQRVTDALAAAYLLEDDPRWQSGFDGDAELWRQAREVVLDAVAGDGTFLDVGCATGHLMECLDVWALERGVRLSMYGLEINGDLAGAARRRLPAWADRIFTGNAADWDPPRQFTYVRAGLEYVPPNRGPALVARLLHYVVEPGGRLIIGPVGEQGVEGTTAAFVKAGAVRPGVCRATDRNGKSRFVVWAASEP